MIFVFQESNRSRFLGLCKPPFGMFVLGLLTNLGREVQVQKLVPLGRGYLHPLQDSHLFHHFDELLPVALRVVVSSQRFFQEHSEKSVLQKREVDFEVFLPGKEFVQFLPLNEFFRYLEFHFALLNHSINDKFFSAKESSGLTQEELNPSGRLVALVPPPIPLRHSTNNHLGGEFINQSPMLFFRNSSYFLILFGSIFSASSVAYYPMFFWFSFRQSKKYFRESICC